MFNTNVNGLEIVETIGIQKHKLENSQSIRIDNIGTLTGRINFHNIEGYDVVTIIMKPPFGTIFTGNNQAGGFGYVVKTSGGTTGNFLNAVTLSKGLEVNLKLPQKELAEFSFYFSFQHTISN